jgi:hypothetical protein
MSANSRSGRLLRAHSSTPNTQFPFTRGYPAQPYTVIGYLAENSHGRFSNAVKEAANSAKRLGADAVLVESRGKSSEPIGALTNATIMPSFCLLMAKESLPQFVAPCADRILLNGYG